MRFDKEINEIKLKEKVYLCFRTWDCSFRRASPKNFTLLDSETAVDRIISELPNICEIKITNSDEFPYPLVIADK